jgi:DNA repair protein RadC
MSSIGTYKKSALSAAKKNIRILIAEAFRFYAGRRQEHFICVSLNGANEVIATRVVSVGLVDKTQVHPREVFADPITDRGSAVIVAHNYKDIYLDIFFDNYIDKN